MKESEKLQKGQFRASPIEPPELQLNRPALIATRARRWAQLRKTFPPLRADIADWAERMEAAHGTLVMIHENVCGWVTALYIARYGENESYWPEHLTEDDVSRAHRWERGAAPANIRYLNVEE